MDKMMANKKKLSTLRHLPPTKRHKYPHMFPLDIEVWERFLDKYDSLYNTFVYDARVGKKTWVFPHWKKEYKKDARVLSQLRIDVLGFRENTIDVIEVKPRFSSSTIGQLLTYHELFKKDFETKRPVRAVVVAGDIDPNLQPMLEKFKIAYIQV